MAILRFLVTPLVALRPLSRVEQIVEQREHGVVRLELDVEPLVLEDLGCVQVEIPPAVDARCPVLLVELHLLRLLFLDKGYRCALLRVFGRDGSTSAVHGIVRLEPREQLVEECIKWVLGFLDVFGGLFRLRRKRAEVRPIDGTEDQRRQAFDG